MIYLNGFVELLEGAGELSFDENGSPIVNEELRMVNGELTTPNSKLLIPAMYQAVTDDKRGKFTDGRFHQQAYEVHIARRTIPKEVKRVRLYDDLGNLLGEFPLQTVAYGRLLNRTALSLGA